MRKHLLTIFASLLLLLIYQSTSAQTPPAAVYGESMVGYNSHTREIFGYGATWEDYSVGYYYRGTKVHSFLLWNVTPEAPLDSGTGESFGSIPSEVLLYSSEYRPVTQYETASQHFVAAFFNWYDEYQGIYYWFNPYGFDNFFENNFGPWFSQPVQGFNPDFFVLERYISLGTTDAKITTPPDPCQSAFQLLDENNNPCPPPEPTPSPLPSPTPLTSVQVTEVGFTGGHQIHRWAEGVPSNQLAINQSEPTWKKVGDPDLPAAYTKGTDPTMFATLTITPALTSNKTVKIRVKNRTNGIVAHKDDLVLSGSSVHIEGLTVDKTKLEETASVKAGSYLFTWQISYDNGSKWAEMGESGLHKIYWTYAAPLSPPFTNQYGASDPHLYDEALKHSAGEAGGLTDVNQIALKITQGIARDIYYDPTQPIFGAHPLFGYSNQGLLCYDNSQLLRVLLRSVGIDGTVYFVWGGDTQTKAAWFYRHYTSTTSYQASTMRMVRPTVNDADLGPYPHFDYHAVLKAGSPERYYDPSYGDSDTTVRIDETFNAKTSTFACGAAASANLILSTTDMSNRLLSTKPCGEQCGHAGVTSVAVNPIDDSHNFVRQQYLDILNREPDTAGWDYWTGVITQCGVDLVCRDAKQVDVALAFFFSGEFIQSNPAFANPNTNAYNSAFVTQCYRSYLRREPDSGGLQFWTSVLNGQIPNGDYPIMIRTFITSIEYRARFGPP
jgi:hypothetical protein